MRYSTTNAVHLVALASIPTDECVEWDRGFTVYGYPAVRFDGKQIHGHRVVCRLSHGEPAESKLEAAHSCGNRRCVNPRHLRWATSLDNSADQKRHGSQPLGEDHHCSKLSLVEVREIKRLLSEGVVQRVLAEQFHVTREAISAIKLGRNWAHLN